MEQPIPTTRVPHATATRLSAARGASWRGLRRFGRCRCAVRLPVHRAGSVPVTGSTCSAAPGGAVGAALALQRGLASPWRTLLSSSARPPMWRPQSWRRAAACRCPSTRRWSSTCRRVLAAWFRNGDSWFRRHPAWPEFDQPLMPRCRRPRATNLNTTRERRRREFSVFDVEIGPACARPTASQRSPMQSVSESVCSWGPEQFWPVAHVPLVSSACPLVHSCGFLAMRLESCFN